MTVQLQCAIELNYSLEYYSLPLKEFAAWPRIGAMAGAIVHSAAILVRSRHANSVCTLWPVVDRKERTVTAAFALSCAGRLESDKMPPSEQWHSGPDNRYTRRPGSSQLAHCTPTPELTTLSLSFAAVQSASRTGVVYVKSSLG